METPQKKISRSGSKKEVNSKTFQKWIRWREEYFKIHQKFSDHDLKMTPEEIQKTKENCKSLLNDIILTAQEQDEAHKIAALKAGKGSQAIGESWMVFHLKALRDNLDEVL